MTTTGSKALEQATAVSCLRGDENVPEELKGMKLRFGGLNGFNEATSRRAGFGTEDEVESLGRSVDYGLRR